MAHLSGWGRGWGGIPACGGVGYVFEEIKDVLRGGAYQTFIAVVRGLPGTLLWVHLGVGLGLGWSAGKGESNC